VFHESGYSATTWSAGHRLPSGTYESRSDKPRELLGDLAVFTFTGQHDQEALIPELFGDGQGDPAVSAERAVDVGSSIDWHRWHHDGHGGRRPDTAHEVAHLRCVLATPPHGVAGLNIESTNPEICWVLLKRLPVIFQRHAWQPGVFIDVFSMKETFSSHEGAPVTKFWAGSKISKRFARSWRVIGQVICGVGCTSRDSCHKWCVNTGF